MRGTEVWHRFSGLNSYIGPHTNVEDADATTRLPPVVYDFRAADSIVRSIEKRKSVLPYDTTPVQVILLMISLSVVMPGCSPGPSE